MAMQIFVISCGLYRNWPLSSHFLGFVTTADINSSRPASLSCNTEIPGFPRYLTAFTGNGLVIVSAPHAQAGHTSWERRVGCRAHHDLRRARAAASHLAERACAPRWTGHTDGCELDPFGACAGLVQHVGGLRGNSWHVHGGVRTQAWVRVFPEFDFLPKDHDEYKEENEDEGENSDADDLSWSDVRQRFCLRGMKRNTLKRRTCTSTSWCVNLIQKLEFSFAELEPPQPSKRLLSLWCQYKKEESQERDNFKWRLWFIHYHTLFI